VRSPILWTLRDLNTEPIQLTFIFFLQLTALCRICEPIAFMSIFPYVYYMVKDFKVSPSESEISVYAGMVTSAFAFAEFSSGVPWGKLSDKIGRKPVLLTGLAGTALSMLIFGFAPSLPVALLARALGGLLNGYAYYFVPCIRKLTRSNMFAATETLVCCKLRWLK
jgi:MFS family permease